MSQRSQPYAGYAKQSRIRARSGVRLAAFFLAVTAVSFLIWGPGWNVWIPLSIAALGIASFLIELLNARFNERKAASTIATGSISAPTEDSRFSLVSRDGDQFYERRIALRGKQATVRIGDKSNLFQKCLPHANELISRLDELGAAFDAFKRKQAELQPDWAEEILAFEIDAIEFFSPKKPHGAEVSFTSESGGEQWTCILDGTEFRDLAQEY